MFQYSIQNLDYFMTFQHDNCQILQVLQYFDNFKWQQRSSIAYRKLFHDISTWTIARRCKFPAFLTVSTGQFGDNYKLATLQIPELGLVFVLSHLLLESFPPGYVAPNEPYNTLQSIDSPTDLSSNITQNLDNFNST